MATYTYVGKGITRREGADKVTGQRTYTVDITLPRMLHAKILRSPYAHALIKSIDTSKAKAHPGVHAVLVGRDIPGARDDFGTRSEATLAVDEVLYYGQPVAAVLAEDLSVAEEAMDLIGVEYEPLTPVVDPVEAVKTGSPLARRSLGEIDRSEEQMHHAETIPEGERELRAGTNISQRVVYTRGDVEKGFAESAVIVEHTWIASMSHQGYIEPQAAVVDCNPNGDYTVWSSTQGLFGQREQLSRVLGVPENRITFESVEMGGGFGGKNQAFTAALCAVLARAVQRPVKYVLSRSDDLKAANPSPQAIMELKTGATKEGKVIAIKARVIVDCGAYPGGPITATCNSIGGFYDVPNYDIEGLEVMTNKVSVGALRAPGQPHGAFAIESQMDMMAEKLGIDPLEFRIMNAAVDETVPPAGRPWGPMYYRQLLESVRETDIWKSRSKLGPNQGVGVAGGGRLSGANRGNAMIAINRDGTASVLVGQHDITGVHTSYAQIAAEELSLPIERVRVFGGSTRSAPYAPNSAGSTALRSTGRAVQMAAQDARTKLLTLAASTLECASEDLEIVNSAIRVKGSPDRSLSIQAVTAQTSGQTPHPSIIGHGNTGAGARVPTFTAVAVKVEVDPDTGLVTILDAVCVQDVGQAINPMLVEGQVQGGLVQALGLGVTEEMVWDENGILRNPNLLDYRMLTALDLPRVSADLMNYG
ncbi:MAG: aldehyde oxidase and xanthine dehydrogenase molybdopterin binding protein, partial [Dehalococcoidia bacterium]|nr:aldehyde oxidase and xanthine dehydrogenase molybdopterin binding protein [Dehalococcoidia bacterium]